MADPSLHGARPRGGASRSPHADDKLGPTGRPMPSSPTRRR